MWIWRKKVVAVDCLQIVIVLVWRVLNPTILGSSRLHFCDFDLNTSFNTSSNIVNSRAPLTNRQGVINAIKEKLMDGWTIALYYWSLGR